MEPSLWSGYLLAASSYLGSEQKIPYEHQRDIVADFLRLDLLERDAYVDLVPRAGRAELLITQAANLLFIRGFRDDDALFVSVDRNGSIDEFVGIVEALVDDE